MDLALNVIGLSPEFIIARNFPWCDEHDDSSFTGRLHEEGVWSADEYWLLERALYELAKTGQHSEEAAWRIFRIFSITSMQFSCHFDTNDRFKIKNLKRAQLYVYRERFQLVFEGFFSREMPDIDSCDLKNPLLSV